MADCTSTGRLRLDGLARYGQDVAEDDVASSGWDEPIGWLVRRATVEVHRYPVIGEELTMSTFGSGIGGRWAERTTLFVGSLGARVASVVSWVAVDGGGRPVRLGERFFEVFGEAAQGRRASVRLLHPGPPAIGADVQPFVLRLSDFDVFDHVNNAVYWAAVEEGFASCGIEWPQVTAELEYRVPIESGSGDSVDLVTVAESERQFSMWLVSDAEVYCSVVASAG